MQIENELERMRDSLHKRKNEVGILNTQVMVIQKDIEGIKVIEEIQNKSIDTLVKQTQKMWEKQLLEQGARENRSTIIKWFMANWFTIFVLVVFLIVHLEWDKFMTAIK